MYGGLFGFWQKAAKRRLVLAVAKFKAGGAGAVTVNLRGRQDCGDRGILDLGDGS